MPTARTGSSRYVVVLMVAGVTCLSVGADIVWMRFRPSLAQWNVHRSIEPRIGNPQDGAINVIRTISRPARIDVPIATLEMGKIDGADAEQFVIADIPGSNRLTQEGGGSVQRDASQSDSESVAIAAEPLHAVAPVPNEQEGPSQVIVSTAALSNARLAVPNLQADSAAEKQTPDSPIPVARLSTEWSAPVAMISSAGSFVGASNSRQLVAGSSWSMVDEKPLADPVSLFDGESLTTDSLRPFAESWQSVSGNHTAPSKDPSHNDLNRAISASKISWRGLYEMGRIAAFIDGPAERIPFYRAAIMSEEWSFIDSTASPRDLRTMEILAGTFIWVQKDDAAATQALRVLMNWEKDAGSPLLQQVTLAYANALDRQGGAREQEVIEPLHSISTSSSSLSKNERLEVHFALGRAYFRSGMYADSTTELKQAVVEESACPFSEHACILLMLAEARSGDVAAAQKLYKAWASHVTTRKPGSVDEQFARDIQATSTMFRNQ